MSAAATTTAADLQATIEPVASDAGDIIMGSDGLPPGTMTMTATTITPEATAPAAAESVAIPEVSTMEATIEPIPEPVMEQPIFEPAPEPTQFESSMAAADQVEASVDEMFADLG